jgi:hypothetical protein
MAKTTRRRMQPPAPAEGAADMPQPENESPGAPSTTPSHDRIADRAYQRYLQRGGGEGSDLEDWFEAERDLKSNS